jgi:hypothetical protein
MSSLVLSVFLQLIQSRVQYRDHLIEVSFSHHVPAYVDEEYGVDVQVRNVDERAMDVTLGFLVRPGEDEWVGEFPSVGLFVCHFGF